MFRLYSTVLLFGLAGCLDEQTFIAEYVEAECAYAMTCYDDAVLNFYGWDSAETCATNRGPEITGEWEGCTIDRPTAKECLKQMEALACPADGADPEYPAICAQVWTCGGDTDGASDTDASTSDSDA